MEMNQIFRIPGGLFLQGAPVFVKEAAMYQQEDGKLVAKLSMENKDAARTICGVTVRFSPIAPNGSVIGEGVIRQYENLQAEPAGLFGEEELVELPEDSCAFGAAVLKVSFTDGTAWEAESKLAWHVL
jgi:hypothetical protein